MANIRQAKVESLLVKDISGILQREVAGWGVSEMVTVTRVRISTDLSHAKVYVSIFPGNRTHEIIDVLRQKATWIRGEAGKALGKQLRIVPELVFLVDDSLDYADRIDELLKK